MEETKSLNQRLIHSPIMACLSGAIILWVSFGIRQTFGVFLVPVTEDTGMSRSGYSIAAALLQLLWGFSQPFLVFGAEQKLGFGKVIFFGSLLYAVGCFVLYGSGGSEGLFVLGMGVLVGIGAGGNSFPNVLASVGRRFHQNSKHQSIAFGIVSSFGSLGQATFLPIARAMLIHIGWKMCFVVMGSIMVGFSPLAYYLQSIPPKPANETRGEEDGEKDRPIEDISAPNIKTALKEALTHPTFLLITLGFSSCGFHVAFLTTHFPAFVQDHGIDPSLASWTISIFGLCSSIGTMLSGYLSSLIQPKYILMAIFAIRAVLMVILIFLPVSITTVIVFSVFFGFVFLSTVPPTTQFIGQVFGQKYLGTLSAITFVGHQIGSFLGAYIAGVLYDQSHTYERMWYGAIAVAVFAILAVDLLNPSVEHEKRSHKLKRLVQSPNSYFMDVKCPGCLNISTVFSHAQTVVLCSSCGTVLCQPTGGRARLTEGCSFRRKAN
ncbi:40S ribosomal protein S27-2 [Choanephora cucurbitarum]|uniref:40S ribosomal protein S27 n=1 Tax=Choanephora cucurbitarum TaxID=101091 RepID=A0A1C7N050_9FUNG|nr:40S ribosomal protein S27-2 [Choanephora cucurbitarum]